MSWGINFSLLFSIASKDSIIVDAANNDLRSYRLDSSKLIKIGFKRKKSFEDAIKDLQKINYQKKLKDDPKFHSVKWLKSILTKV